jgi:hypothetical protein
MPKKKPKKNLKAAADRRRRQRKQHRQARERRRQERQEPKLPPFYYTFVRRGTTEVLVLPYQTLDKGLGVASFTPSFSSKREAQKFTRVVNEGTSPDDQVEMVTVTGQEFFGAVVVNLPRLGLDILTVNGIDLPLSKNGAAHVSAVTGDGTWLASYEEGEGMRRVLRDFIEISTGTRVPMRLSDDGGSEPVQMEPGGTTTDWSIAMGTARKEALEAESFRVPVNFAGDVLLLQTEDGERVLVTSASQDRALTFVEGVLAFHDVRGSAFMDWQDFAGSVTQEAEAGRLHHIAYIGPDGIGVFPAEKLWLAEVKPTWKRLQIAGVVQGCLTFAACAKAIRPPNILNVGSVPDALEGNINKEGSFDAWAEKAGFTTSELTWAYQAASSPFVVGWRLSGLQDNTN